ncbi:hypothetical protein JCM39194_19800 [Desulfotomaculum varum]
MAEIADLINDEMEAKGRVEFVLEDPALLNSDLKEYTVFYKIVGASRMKLYRNNRNELVFVRLNDDWMRQAKLDIANAALPLEVKLCWDNGSVDELAVKKPGETAFCKVTAAQIDN